MWGNSSLYPFYVRLDFHTQIYGSNRWASSKFFPGPHSELWILFLSVFSYFLVEAHTRRHLTWTHAPAWVRAILYPASRWPLPSGSVTDPVAAGYWASCPTSWVIYPEGVCMISWSTRLSTCDLSCGPAAHLTLYMDPIEKYMLCSACEWEFL